MSVLHAPLIALAALAFASVANAEAGPVQGAPGESHVQGAGFAGLEAGKLDSTALSALSGGSEATAITDQTLVAVNSGNTVNADTVTTGPVSLNANAFSGFAGIGNFVINTGNNNNLQGSLSVNIVMTPGS
jgi:hypothetical protein